jgi:tetratricopeptide (TPR) repeat protein
MMGQVMTGEDTTQLVQQVLARLQREYEHDQPGPVGETLGLIWAARRGLTETELLHLLKPADLGQPLRAALGEVLVDRDGILNFANDSLRAAVETAVAPDEDRRDELRLQLADYFERQSISVRSCDELPWLLLQTESYQRLRQCLLDIDRFLEIKKRDEEELRRYWVDIGEERTMGSLYLASFEHWSKVADREEKLISYAANELCLFLSHSGLYEEAEQLIRRALDIDTKILGSDHPFISIRLTTLASLLESVNRQHEDQDEVEGLYRRALAISEQNFGREHSRVALCLSNLAAFLVKTSRFDEAERLVRRGLAIDEQYLGPNHPNVAVRLNNLAGLLLRSDNLAQAEAVVRRSLEITESNFGSDHPNVAAGLSNLVFVLHRTNRLAEAEPLMRRILAIDEKAYGPEHIAVARDLNNLAGLLESTNRLAEAEPFYRRAQLIFEKNLGENHPDVGTSLNNLAQVLKKMNRLDEAEPILMRAVQIFLELTRSTQQLDPRLQITINNYGRLLEQQGCSMEQIDTALYEIAPDMYRRTNQGTA